MKNKNREILIDLQENFEEYMQSIAEDNKYINLKIYHK